MALRRRDDSTTDLMPSITAETPVKTTAGTLWAAGGFIVAAAIWGTVVYLDVQRLKANDEEKTRKLDQLSESVAHIRWILEPTTSNPVITGRKP